MDRSLYIRPNKPKTIPVKKRPREFVLGAVETPTLLSVDSSTECHVTRNDIAEMMADYLELDDGLKILEPQCGTGNLVNAIVNSGFNLNITAIEKNVELYRAFTKRFSRGVESINTCFLEYSAFHGQIFDRVICNPPFRQVKQHISAALKLLKPDGFMIALVPVTFSHLDAEHLETLEKGCFENTNVTTKIIRIDRHA